MFRIGFFSILLFISAVKSQDSSYPVYCKLKWVSEGYGNIPSLSIESGSKEYVGRAFHSDQWIPGRVSPSNGKIFITHEGTVVEYDTYEVLTNPDNCLLQWVDEYGGSIPRNAVPVNSITDMSVVIGRGQIAGLTLGGKVVVEESAIFISYEGKEELRRSYQVLRSFYPPLKVRLSNFNFVSDFNSLKSKKELIGQEGITNSHNSEISQQIDHGKIVQERFTLTEDDHNWEGIGEVSFNFPVWYGSSDVSGHFELNPDALVDTELTIYRDREIRMQRAITVKAASGTSAKPLQVCSTVLIVEDLEAAIPFTAIATYEAENMSAKQVEEIVKALDRTVVVSKAHKRNSVTGTFSGHLNGRFAISFSSYTSDLHADGVCADHPSI